MTNPNCILMFGQDAHLLETRKWVLERAGFATTMVTTLAALNDAIAETFYEVLILCHSLSAMDCETSVSLAALQAPGMQILRLEAGSGVQPLALKQTIDVSVGPIGLIKKVQSLFCHPPLPSQTEEIEMSQHERSVEWFNNAKGYGFVGGSDGDVDIFAHYSAIKSEGYRTLQESNAVTFDIVQGEEDRLQTDQVRVVKKA
ncbi:MAG: cold shock domain-containing protein [Janthinobacterium lividum]